MTLDPLTVGAFFCFDCLSAAFPLAGGRPRGRLEGKASWFWRVGCALVAAGRPRGRFGSEEVSFFEAMFALVAGRPRGRLGSGVSVFEAMLALVFGRPRKLLGSAVSLFETGIFLAAGRPRKRFKGAKSLSTKDFRVFLSIFGDNEVDFLTLWVGLTSGVFWRLFGLPAALVDGGAVTMGGSGGGKSGFGPCPTQISGVGSLCVVTGGGTRGFSQVTAMLSSYLPTSGSTCSQKSNISMPAGLIPQNLRRL